MTITVMLVQLEGQVEQREVVGALQPGMKVEAAAAHLEAMLLMHVSEL